MSSDERSLQVKQFLPVVEKKTIVDTPDVQTGERPNLHHILQIAIMADMFNPWGVNVAGRDVQLREFWPTEPWLASTVYAVTIRNAGFAWEVVGSDPSAPQPKNTVRAVTRMLKAANRGKGWQDLIVKTCVDMYTQDNGAFWETIRRQNRPDSPVINIAHLDAGRCLRTGDPEYPVIYTDRNGTEHIMRWWQVKTLEEFPSPIETMYGVGYCAVTRALLAAQILRDVAIYKHEKVSGSFTRAVDVVGNVQQSTINDAIEQAQEQQLNRGIYRYTQPLIITGIDPTSTLSHVHIDLASLPDSFDEDVVSKWYVAQLALAFGVDYQEIAPLMTGNLGAGSQSETLHMKTHGKGPASFMANIETQINDGGLIPSNVLLRYKEQDVRTELEKANARFTRSKARSLQLQAGELDPEASRQVAVLDGDLPEYLVNEIAQREKQRMAEDKRAQKQQARQLQNQQGDTPNNDLTPKQVGGGSESHIERKAEKRTAKQQYVTMEDIEKFRERLGQKSSWGVPDGTVILGLSDLQQLMNFQDGFVGAWFKEPIRWTPPNQLHVSLVHASLVDEPDYFDAYQAVKGLFYPRMISSSKLGVFDQGEMKVLVLFVDKTPELARFQAEVYAALKTRNAVLSEFSDPKQWTPHITLGYLPKDVDVPDEWDIKLIWCFADRLVFSRGEHQTYYVTPEEAPEIKEEAHAVPISD